MSLENIKEFLFKFGWEYKISFNDEVIYSKDYDKLTKNKIYEDTFQFENNYYKKKIKTIVIDEVEYVIEYLEDVTKYIEFVLVLKKDKITGLATREDLEDYISKLRKTSIFVLCDIDDFKKVNDNYGHLVGDQILNLLGSIIKSNIRERDFAGRYGGEEFLIIFDTDNIESVKLRIDKINNEFNNKSMNLNLSFSAGISFYDGSKKITKTIKEADVALYFVKRNGKKNSAIYSNEMEENFTK